jgi:hypothetical protein
MFSRQHAGDDLYAQVFALATQAFGGALRPIVRCGFEPPVPVGKKAVHRFAALIIASAVAITPAQAQTASELRISGTVEKLDGNLAALSLSRGISLVVRLDSEPRVNSVAKGSGSDLKAGSQVSIQAKNGQSGDHRNSDRLVRSGVEQT